MGNKNLTVLTEAPAAKLTFTGTRCTGVEFLRDGKLCSVAASREVVLWRSTRRASSCSPALAPKPTLGRSASTPSSISRAWGGHASGVPSGPS
jgi:hypothetical protein